MHASAFTFIILEVAVQIASLVWLSYGLLLVNRKVMDVLNIMVCTVTVGIDVVDIVGIGDGLNDSPIELK